MLIAGFLVLSGLLFWYELTRLRRHGGGKRETVAFVTFMVLATAFAGAVILQLPLPNPAKAIEAIFRPLGEMVIPPG